MTWGGGGEGRGSEVRPVGERDTESDMGGGGGREDQQGERDTQRKTWGGREGGDQ